MHAFSGLSFYMHIHYSLVCSRWSVVRVIWHKAASPPHSDRSVVFATYRQCAFPFNTWFYRAMLCIRGTTHGPVSVCVCLSVSMSVTSRCSTKTAKRRITQTTPHDTPGTLVFWCQKSPRNSTGVTPYEGAECRWGGSKSATFDIYPAVSRKR